MTKVYLLLKLMFTTFADWWNEPFTPNESSHNCRTQVASDIMEEIKKDHNHQIFT